uniref:Major tropism determinant N-terminal domain-containing protein n=1 Tax=viral metagenome TaxID=1070528 RepID=A0A6C0JKU5_9ZZZZ
MPFIQLQFRRDLSSNWTSNDPTLAPGELGIETDTNLFKIGSGTNWVGTSYGGLQGATASIAVGTVTTLSPGATATVADSGTSYASIFDFGIPQGVTGPTGGTEGIQYTLTGSTIGATFTNFPTATTFTASTWTLFSTISFKVPPNWSSPNSVCWDGHAFYDFSLNNVNYWAVYYTTNLQSTLQPLLGTSATGATNINNAIFSSSPQTYLPFNLIIPSTHLQAGPTGTINLLVYGFTTGTTITLQNPPQISGRVSVALV